MNDAEALQQAKDGRLSSVALEEVARALESGAPRRDPYTLIHILAAADGRRFEPVVARFTLSPDPMVAGMALRALCIHWSLASKYRNQIVAALKRPVHGGSENLRQTAVQIVGELLRQEMDHNLVAIVLEIFDDETNPPITRQGAYFALARSMGRSWSEIPPASRIMDMARDVDPEVVRWARNAAK